MRYFIGYHCDEKVEEYYRTLTRELSARFGVKDLAERVPAHMTFVYPFETDDVSGVKERLSRIARESTTAKLTFAGFDRFDDNTETIFLAPTVSPEIALVLKRCIAELGTEVEQRRLAEGRFRLHVSIARHLDPEKFREVMEHLRALPEPRFTSLLDNLTLFVLPAERWEVEERFPLLSGTA